MKRAMRLILFALVSLVLRRQTLRAQVTTNIDVPQGAVIARLKYTTPTVSTRYYYELAWDTSCGWCYVCDPPVQYPPHPNQPNPTATPYSAVLSAPTGTLASANGVIPADTYISIADSECPYSAPPYQYPPKPDDVVGIPINHHQDANIADLTKNGPISLTLTVSGLNEYSVQIIDKPTVYVDVDGAFDPANPVDDYGKFIPGSDLNGINVSPATMLATGQRINLHVISAADLPGNITCLIDSATVSRLPGIAMNYPADNSAKTLADLSLSSDTDSEVLSISVPINSSGDTIIPLYVRDYAAYGKLTVRYDNGSSHTMLIKQRELPKSTAANRIPDRGWKVKGAWIANTGIGTAADEDLDADPPSFGNPSTGLLGDGLTTFEEYRGFVTAGELQRLDPNKKDVFIVADAELLIEPMNALSVLHNLPQRLHYLDKNEARLSNDVKPEINPNRTGIAGATSQRAIRLRMRLSPPILHRTATNEDFPAEFFLAGYTWQDQEDLQTVNDPSIYGTSNPNGTQASELYPAAFQNFAIAFGPNGQSDSVIDDQGNPVVTCQNPATDTHCVYIDNQHQVIRRPAQEFKLYAIAGGDDYYTKVSYANCALMDNHIRALTADQFQKAQNVTIGHEAAHSLGVHHTTDCGDIMFTLLIGQNRRISVIDVLPMPLTYSENDSDAMRIHANQ